MFGGGFKLYADGGSFPMPIDCMPKNTITFRVTASYPYPDRPISDA